MPLNKQIKRCRKGKNKEKYKKSNNKGKLSTNPHKLTSHDNFKYFFVFLIYLFLMERNILDKPPLKGTQILCSNTKHQRTI